MYSVTTGTPNGSISKEYWLNELRAYLISDIINKTTDEFTGAIVEVLTESTETAKDQDYEGFYIEYTWDDKRSLSDISCLIKIAPDIWIDCQLEVRLDVNGNDVSYVVRLGDTICQHEDEGDIELNLNSKSSELLLKLITEDSKDREYFHQHESEEVDEANRISLDDSQPETNTL